MGTHNVFIWPLQFFCGMLTFKLFEWYRRGLTTGGQVWGWITDLLGLAGILINAYVLWAPVPQVFNMFYTFFARLCLNTWLYGLATGQGITAKGFGNSFLADTLSPAAYAVYLFHGPVCICWVIVSRSVTYPLTGVGPDLELALSWGLLHGNPPLFWWEFPFVTAFIWWFSWYATMHWSEKLSARFQQIFDRGYCWCCCLCSGVGILCWRPEDVGAETDTMLTVLDTSSSTDETYVRPVGPRRWIFRGCDWRIFAGSAPERSPSSDSAMNCAAVSLKWMIDGCCNSSRAVPKRKRHAELKLKYRFS